MYRAATIVSACILFVVLIAIIVINSRTSETLSSEASKLKSDINKKTTETRNITEENNGLNVEVTTEIIEKTTEILQKIEDHVSAASSTTNGKVKVIPSTTYGKNELENKHSAAVDSRNEIIAGLREKIKEAEANLEERQKRLKDVQRRAKTANNLSKETQNQFEMLITAMNALQNSILYTSNSSNEAFWQVQLQTSKYNEAKRKYTRLVIELESSKQDYEKMKMAVNDAARAAKLAMNNVHVTVHSF